MNIYQYFYKHINSVKSKENWDFLKSEISLLNDEKIYSVENLEQFIDKVNEFDILINEIDEKFYIQSMQDSKNESIQKLKTQFESSILNIFNKERKIINSKIIRNIFFKDLIHEKPIFKILYDCIRNESKSLNEEVCNLDSQIALQVTKYNNQLAKMTIEVDGEIIPTIVASMTKLPNLKDDKKKKLLKKINHKEEQFTEIYNDIYDELLKLRTKKAEELGFSNYRDYSWREMNRNQYTPKDVECFCNSISDIFIPILTKTLEYKKNLKKENLLPINYFSSVKELKEKTNNIFSKIHTDFHNYFNLLEENNKLDFELRENKSPAMFTSNLPESGIPFVYLLAVNNIQGISSVFHEVTHAIHLLYNTDKKKVWLKKPDIEVNELFPLTMEFISMEYWDDFFDSEKDLLIAKLNKFEHSLSLFKMIGLWDKFQTWVYLNPIHNHKERNDYWLFLLKKFNMGKEPENKNRSKTSWQNRPLIFRYPFYLVEYGFATLAAISIYKNYRQDKKKTIEQFISAMKLGNTKSLKEIYKTSGVNFDFTKGKIKETADFLSEEIEVLYLRLKEFD